MPRILVVTDVPWARNEVHAALTRQDVVLLDHTDPATAAARAQEESVDAVIVDFQVGSMGGMAVTRSIRGGAAVEGHQARPVVLLLDRAADAFLARRAGATGWVVKPFTSHQLTSAVDAALANAAGPISAE